MDNLKIALAQLNFPVGAIEANKDKIIATHKTAVKEKADLVVFPELCVTGYPPEDLVLRHGFQKQAMNAAREIALTTKGSKTSLLIGCPWAEDHKLYNSALLIYDGEIRNIIHKHDLPNYGIFDEKRIFDAGASPSTIQWRGLTLGIMICEDMWNMDLTEPLRGSDILLSINGSPYEIGKHEKRLERASIQSRALGRPLIYVNQFCGQDDLVFDGDSFVVSGTQEMIVRLSRSAEQIEYTEWTHHRKTWECKPIAIKLYKSEAEVSYLAMVTGLREYVNKNSFPGVILGLSGGIDSALTAAVAVDALGPERVKAVMMPSRFTSEESLKDAKSVASKLGIKYYTESIENIYESFEQQLSEQFAGTEKDLTEENLQSRIRGTLLMALSNKFGDMVVATGNKSEMAVGYATLYGDMCGGYSVLKDVYKTNVFKLCYWRNENLPENSLGPSGEVIPERVIKKAPTAELRENQKDEDSLPPYETLDMILYHLIEQDWPVEKIIAEGYDRETVEKTVHMVYNAEYKRRQSPPGVKISIKPFGRDRRYPITNWHRGIEDER
jgi:NAD+ synthase